MRTFSKGTSIAVLLLLVFSFAANVFANAGPNHPAATQDDMWTALKTDDGLLFVWNRTDLHFTLLIKGKDFTPMNDPNNIFFVVDGIILQIQSLPIKNFAPNAGKDKLDDKSILLAHRDWESAFLENELLRSKIQVKSSSEKTGGAEALLWQYDLPEKFRSPDAIGQMYLTRVAQDYVILLNAVVNPDVTEANARKFLVDTMTTLKLSSERIDIKKLQDSIRKGNAP